MRKIPFSKPNINLNVLKNIEKVIKSGWLIEGRNVEEFEHRFAKYCNVKYAVATSSGTAALFLALKSVGIKPGYEVIVPSLTFIASSNSIIHVGAKPIFADIDKDTFNIDPKSIEEKITKKTKAILPVHLYGQSCDMDEIKEIAKKHNLKVIEDSAQSIGSEYKNKKTGSLGDIACFSFHPAKNMTTGEGGVITTNNEEIAKKIKILKNHGMAKSALQQLKESSEREFIEIGYNFRMPEINAVLGISQLEDLEKNNRLRIMKAKLYNKLLSKIHQVITPFVKSYNKHTYFTYTIKCKNRDELKEFLHKNGISCIIHHRPVHLEIAYRKLFHYKEGYLPVTESVCQEILCLPLFSILSEEDIKFICKKVKKFYSTS